MKKLKYLFILLISTAALSSCSDELDDELFYKFAYLTSNGWKSYDLDVSDENTADLKIYFGVNGTSDNDQDIIIEIEADPDTLAAYNFDKFKNQTQFYYPILPAQAYTFDKSSYTIRAGEITATAIANIDMKKLDDPYQEYVLPIRIKSATGIGAGPGKYTKLLANILFTNQYSGAYSGSGTLKEVGTNSTLEVSGARLYATSTNACYVYAGNVTRSNTDNYRDYAIDLSFEENGDINMWCNNQEMEFEPLAAKMERKYSIIYDDNRYYNQTTTLSLEYRYKDLTPGEDRKLSYTGTISINKKVLKTDYPDVPVEE